MKNTPNLSPPQGGGKPLRLDLFGAEIPDSPEDLPRLFVAHIRRVGHGEFNAWRCAHGFQRVPRWIGAQVEAACRRAGFIQYGHAKAQAKASRSRIVGIWRDPRGGTEPKSFEQAVAYPR